MNYARKSVCSIGVRLMCIGFVLMLLPSSIAAKPLDVKILEVEKGTSSDAINVEDVQLLDSLLKNPKVVSHIDSVKNSLTKEEEDGTEIIYAMGFRTFQHVEARDAEHDICISLSTDYDQRKYLGLHKILVMRVYILPKGLRIKSLDLLRLYPYMISATISY